MVVLHTPPAPACNSKGRSSDDAAEEFESLLQKLQFVYRGELQRLHEANTALQKKIDKLTEAHHPTLQTGVDNGNTSALVEQASTPESFEQLGSADVLPREVKAEGRQEGEHVNLVNMEMSLRPSVLHEQEENQEAHEEAETESDPSSDPEFLKGKKNTPLKATKRNCWLLKNTARIAKSVKFEALFAVLIILNTILIVIEVEQYTRKLRHGYGTATRETPNIFFVALEVFLLLAFTIELLIKLIGLGWTCDSWSFWRDPWNLLDTLLLVGGWIYVINASALPCNMSVGRLMRLFRLIRLLKLVQGMNTAAFDQLLVLITAIRESMFALFWTSLMMICIQGFIALVLNQYLVVVYFADPSVPEKHREELFTRFGTFSRCFFTMFELSLANWTPAVRLLAEHVHEVFFFLGIAYKMIMGFAVVGIMNGIFIRETFRVASMDDFILLRTQAQSVASNVRKLKKFFAIADCKNDGKVDRHEFARACKKPNVQLWLKALELDVGNPEELFDMFPRMTTTLTFNKGQPSEVVISQKRGAFQVVRVGLRAQRMGVQVGWILKSVGDFSCDDWHLDTAITHQDLVDILPLLGLQDTSAGSFEVRFKYSREGEALTFGELAHGLNKLRGHAMSQDCQFIKRKLYDLKHDVKFLKGQVPHAATKSVVTSSAPHASHGKTKSDSQNGFHLSHGGAMPTCLNSFDPGTKSTEVIEHRLKL